MPGTIRFTVDSDEGAALAALIDNPRIIGYVTLSEGTYIERDGSGRFPLFLVTPDRDFTISGCSSDTDGLFNATIELTVSKTADGHLDASDECRKILVDVVWMAGITVRNKVLLYLGKYSGIDYCEYDMPKDLTQDGISAALAISRAHACQEVKKLLNKEWATVRLAHSKGYSSKRKVYFLTPEGIAECKALSNALSSAGTDFSSFFLETQMNKTAPRGRIIEARSEINLAAEAMDDGKLTEAAVHMTKAIQQIVFELGSERNGDA